MEYDLRLDEGSFLIYIEETGELYIGYDVGDYSLVFETSNSLQGLTYFQPQTDTQTRNIEGQVDVTATPSKSAQEKSYINQLVSMGKAQIIETKNDFYTAKGVGDLQDFVFVDYAYSQLDSAIKEYGANALANFTKKLEAKATNAPWWQDSAYRTEAANWYRKYGSEGYQLWLDTTHDKWLEDNGYDSRTFDAWREYSKSESKWNDKIANYKTQLESIVASKGGELSDAALEYAANEWAWGRWDALKAQTQVKKAVDDGEEGILDVGFASFLADTDVIKTTLQEKEVQDDLNTYLPSDMHNMYVIKDIAKEYRNNPAYRNSFIEQLKDDRFTKYSQYDRNTPWNRILAGKKSSAASVWGLDISNIKDNDPIIIQMLSENAPDKELQLLRQAGMDRGYDKVMTEFAKSIASVYGTGVVRSSGFRD